MPVTADTTIIAQALAQARALARQATSTLRPINGTSRVEVLRQLRDTESDFDSALEALKRIEAEPPPPQLLVASPAARDRMDLEKRGLVIRSSRYPAPPIPGRRWEQRHRVRPSDDPIPLGIRLTTDPGTGYLRPAEGNELCIAVAGEVLDMVYVVIRDGKAFNAPAEEGDHG